MDLFIYFIQLDELPLTTLTVRAEDKFVAEIQAKKQISNSLETN